MSQKTELWMGRVKPYMDENFIRNAFKNMGVDISGVRMIKTVSGKPHEYCFVQFPDDISATLALHRLERKLIPGTEPPVKFYLDHSISVGGKHAIVKEHSLFVSNLSPDVDNWTLFKSFFDRYPSVRRAFVTHDKNGKSKGHGIVRFAKEEEQKKALIEMDMFNGIGSNVLYVNTGRYKKNVQVTNRSSSLRQAGSKLKGTWYKIGRSHQSQPATSATTTQPDHSQNYKQSRNDSASSAQWPSNENFDSHMYPEYDYGPEQSSLYQLPMMPTAYQGVAHGASMGMQMAHSSGHVAQQQNNPWQPQEPAIQPPPLMSAANIPPLLPTPPIGIQMDHSSQYVGQQQPSAWQSAASPAATYPALMDLPMSRRRKAEHVYQQQNDDNDFFGNFGPARKKRKQIRR